MTRILIYLRNGHDLRVKDLAHLIEVSPVRVSTTLCQAGEFLLRFKLHEEGAHIAADTATHGSNSCRWFREHRCLYRDGDLAALDLLSCREHLRNCQECLEHQTRLSCFEQELHSCLRQQSIHAATLRDHIEAALTREPAPGVWRWARTKLVPRLLFSRPEERT